MSGRFISPLKSGSAERKLRKRIAHMTGYCALHVCTYPRAEGCPECRKPYKESLIELTNRLYDKHVPSKL